MTMYLGPSLKYDEATKRVTKTEPRDLVEHQLAFFIDCPQVAPPEVQMLSESSYSYRFVPGHKPMNTGPVLSAATRFVWRRPWRPDSGHEMPSSGPQTLELVRYAAYVLERASAAQISPARVGPILWRWLVNSSRLSPAVAVHGDLTFENIVMTDGALTFLDPGRPLVRVVELDLGKLAQSYNAPWVWDTQARPFLSANARGMFERPEVKAFELTHWIRLMRHPEKFQGRRVMSDAIVRIDQLLGELEAL